MFQNVVQELENANTAEEILVSTIRYINMRKDEAGVSGSSLITDYPSPSIIKELQGLLMKKIAQNPGLLRSLLSVHLQEFMAVLQQATTSPSDLDSSLKHLLNQLSVLSIKVPPSSSSSSSSSSPSTAEGNEKYSPSSTQRPLALGTSQKGDFSEPSKLEQLTEKLQEKIKKVKEIYGLNPGEPGMLDDIVGQASPQTKESKRKDEL